MYPKDILATSCRSHVQYWASRGGHSRTASKPGGSMWEDMEKGKNENERHSVSFCHFKKEALLKTLGTWSRWQMQVNWCWTCLFELRTTLLLPSMTSSCWFVAKWHKDFIVQNEWIWVNSYTIFRRMDVHLPAILMSNSVLHFCLTHGGLSQELVLRPCSWANLGQTTWATLGHLASLPMAHDLRSTGKRVHHGLGLDNFGWPAHKTGSWLLPPYPERLSDLDCRFGSLVWRPMIPMMYYTMYISIQHKKSILYMYIYIHRNALYMTVYQL
jgi:hypothetical protein